MRLSSEYETSDNDRKVDRSIYSDADTRDMMNGASSWPYDLVIGHFVF